MKNNTTHEESTISGKGVGIAVAAGALAAGAAAAGYYFYASDNAKAHRRDAALWARSFKKEVMRQMEDVKEFDRATIMAAVDRAVGVYEQLRAVDAAQLIRAAKELKDHWQELAGEYTAAPPARVKSRHGSTARKPLAKRRSTKATKKSA